MNNKIKFIFFDVGGVFCDTELIYDELSLKFGRNRDHMKASHVKYVNLACLGGLSVHDVWDLIREDLEINPKDNFNFLEFSTDKLIPIPLAHELAKELAHSYKIGLITDVERDVFEKSLEKGNVPDINYSAIIKSSDHKIIKPDVRIYQIAEEKSGATGPEILYVEDVAENVEAAQKFGWKAVRFLTNDPEASIKQIKSILSG
ncbi:hypothetical protein A2962_03410 [Candidatus Woesebacteria bacterium RIFCSPLOWO2_01_FULL_39_61]|uniref:HAD family hydrolase n=1 Tax=Candidatus Woesebacteria bacterium RIFCSPHIGHO2_02_FULL_39_13 TaxID=1802505 RepID=A0A1F7Z2W7_9BACT|nr:MAG: hypothetical protein A2692_04495 [Candidatus Woesebacteria bacterium RIFCSPHIGHO2_01_FULL_39_95]OGM33871.1 MAG: hypothetical protein A3D01_02780 [Candidatus Woesebacteria bacterium RIFCSPHIGHO2_02_FULL_39_13]OGM39032.1 MAG: hypothetical protein A3E13_05050 [Candidatus Woesebacteria bacterium RIFCSPHIGHO2_12_FULL_40_20]OGM67537.1 MAG: hypothetical protein A2962_03410 [Candidatus Woesebacteria bacterium RIFCSPLOWO2_01_FULL_39_61]OGM73694.1 MAG: hypothetical protein A3H19_06505 [Candidatus